VAGEGVLLMCEDFSKVLQGGAYEKVVPLVDGLHTADQMVDALAGVVDAATVYYVLHDMQARAI
jgi:ribosomal protein S12 methylthiotransferase accessory factor